MTIHIRSQKFARAAFEQVLSRSESRETQKKEYLSFTRSFPTMIHTSGLSQALAFAMAKGTKQPEKRYVIDDLCRVLHAAGHGWLPGDGEINGAALAQRARADTDAVEYMRLTRHSLQAASWIKRYAEALLVEVDPKSDLDEQPDEVVKT